MVVLTYHTHSLLILLESRVLYSQVATEARLSSIGEFALFPLCLRLACVHPSSALSLILRVFLALSPLCQAHSYLRAFALAVSSPDMLPLPVSTRLTSYLL